MVPDTMRFDFHGMRRKAVVTAALNVAFSFAALLWTATGAQAYKLKVLYAFCAETNCTDGQAPSPYAPVVMDAAGNLFGTTADGGDQGDGVVFKLSPPQGHKGWKFERIYSFCAEPACADGTTPIGNLVVDVSGNVFGVSRFGGSGNGSVFELSPPVEGKTWTFAIVHSFCSESGCADGSQPFSGLTYQGAASGLPYDGTSPLYGVTSEGGTQGKGAAYQLVPVPQKAKWKESVLYSFCVKSGCTDGQTPTAVPILDGAGNLYGVTDFGGATQNGVLFKLSPGGGKRWRNTVLHSFCAVNGCSDGGLANKLVMDGQGNLFGTAVFGGTSATHAGVAFELVANGSQPQYSVLYNFCSQSDCRDGASPKSELLIDAAGALLGTAFNGGGHDTDLFNQGGGTVFKLTGTTLQTLHRFCSKPNCVDGMYPYAGMIANPSGVLFGITEVGGAHDGGEVFEMTP